MAIRFPYLNRTYVCRVLFSNFPFSLLFLFFWEFIAAETCQKFGGNTGSDEKLRFFTYAYMYLLLEGFFVTHQIPHICTYRVRWVRYLHSTYQEEHHVLILCHLGIKEIERHSIHFSWTKIRYDGLYIRTGFWELTYSSAGLILKSVYGATFHSSFWVLIEA